MSGAALGGGENMDNKYNGLVQCYIERWVNQT
jgi:hypothetical protein